MEQPNFYGILPATVRYCEGLIPNAKLLYCEITALCSAKGHCWASNSYFAKLYDVSDYTVSRWISQLQSFGFISVVVNKTAGNQRLIYIKDSPPIAEKRKRGLRKSAKPSCANEQAPLAEKRKQSNTVNTTSITTGDCSAAGKKTGFSKTSPEVAPPVPAPPPTLFSESGWPMAGLDKWRTELLSQGFGSDIDTDYYYRRCQTWSRKNSKTSADWIAFAAGIAQDDFKQGKLKLKTENIHANSGSASPTTSSGKQQAFNKERTIARAARILGRTG